MINAFKVETDSAVPSTIISPSLEGDVGMLPL